MSAKPGILASRDELADILAVAAHKRKNANDVLHARVYNTLARVLRNDREALPELKALLAC